MEFNYLYKLNIIKAVTVCVFAIVAGFLLYTNSEGWGWFIALIFLMLLF